MTTLGRADWIPQGELHSPFCTERKNEANCACGANYSCRTCGYGAGTYPCECSKRGEPIWNPMPDPQHVPPEWFEWLRTVKSVEPKVPIEVLDDDA